MTDIKNTLNKIDLLDIALQLWATSKNDFLSLNKNQVREIKNNLHKAPKEEQETLKKLINNYCDAFRCSSLYID